MPKYPKRTPPSKLTIVSIDPGQAKDPFAIVLIHAHVKSKVRRWRETGRRRVYYFEYHVRLLERLRGKPYPEVTDRTLEVVEKAWHDKNADETTVYLACDITGVGRAIGDQIKKDWRERAQGTPMKYRPAWIHITPGDQTHYTNGTLYVPKRELVTALVLAMENGLFKLAYRIPLRQEFLQEMRTFRAKISAATAHDSYEHWREGDYDDMLLAAADGVFIAERYLRPSPEVLPAEDDEIELAAEPAGRTAITATPMPVNPAYRRLLGY